MRIALLTTLPTLSENKRIATEVENLGHQFRLISLTDFRFVADQNGLVVGEIGEVDFDVAIVRGIFNSIKPIAVVINMLRSKGVKVFDNNLSNHLYSIDKVTDIAKLASSGISVPRTSYSHDFTDYPSLADKTNYPVIVKLTRSGKGAHVYKADDQDQLLKLISELEAKGKSAKSYIMQEFIDYEHDLRVLVIGGSVFAMKRIPRQGDFRANFSLGGTVELFDLESKDQELAIKALAAVDMSVGGVDILIDKKGNRFILEVNHTAGFVGMEEATKKNIGKIFVEHTLEQAK